MGGSTVTCNCEAMECCHIYCELNTVTCDCGAILLCSHIYCSPRDGISFVEDRIFVGTMATFKIHSSMLGPHAVMCNCEASL